MTKAYATYKINNNRTINVFVETNTDFFGGVAPVKYCINFFNDLYNFIDSECVKRGWRLEKIGQEK